MAVWVAANQIRYNATDAKRAIAAMAVCAVRRGLSTPSAAKYSKVAQQVDAARSVLRPNRKRIGKSGRSAGFSGGAVMAQI